MPALGRPPAPGEGNRRARAACVAALLLAPGTDPPRAQPATAPGPAQAAPAAPKRNIAGPGDFALREKIVHLVGRDPDLAKERFNIILVNGGAGVSGGITSLPLKKRAPTLAAPVRGVVNVT